MDRPTYVSGDRVRHPRRPEWGIGTVQRVELVARPGDADQRLHIRFPSAGLKTLLASAASLEKLDAGAVASSETLVAREASHEQGWLGEIAKKQPGDAMTALPATASDPFLPARRRLEFTLGLYRFEPTPSSLVAWAVAQTGLDDPLSRFTRHELEEYFRRWALERDSHLGRLLALPELRNDPEAVRTTVAAAIPIAQQAWRRVNAMR